MPEQLPVYLAPTFAERKAARERDDKAAVKAVQADETDEVENKAVAPKKTTRKTAKKA